MSADKILMFTQAGLDLELGLPMNGGTFPRMANLIICMGEVLADDAAVQAMTAWPDPWEVKIPLGGIRRYPDQGGAAILGHILKDLNLPAGKKITGIGIELEDDTEYAYAPYYQSTGGFEKPAGMALTVDVILAKRNARVLEVRYEPYDTASMAATVLDTVFPSLPSASTDARGLMDIDHVRDLNFSQKQNIVFVEATASSGLYHQTNWQLPDLNSGHEIDSSFGRAGVLLNATGNPFIDVCLPYCVVIGDSISEGHPVLHGIKHLGTDDSHWGQISFHLSENYNIPVLNHGIGGQTTQQIRSRWQSDAVSPIDGAQPPQLIYLHVGINDVFLREDVNSIKDNYAFFAESCRSNGIRLCMGNIGPHGAWTDDKLTDAREINRWLSAEFAALYPDVIQVDYLAWASGETSDYSVLQSGMFADAVHPNRYGYSSYSRRIIAEIDSVMPMYLSSVEFFQRPGGASHFHQSALRINDLTVPAGDHIQYPINGFIDGQPIGQPIVRVFFNSFDDYYVGLSGVRARLLGAPKPDTPSLGVVLAASAVVIRGVVSNNWDNFGISVSTDTLDNLGHINITTDEAIHSLDLEMVGTPSTYGNGGFYMRWISGIAVNGLKTWNIVVYDKTDAPVTNINAYTFQIKGWKHV